VRFLLFLDNTEIRALLRIMLSGSTSVGERQLKTLVYCVAMLDYMREDFVTRMGLQMRKSHAKTYVRLANG
jgi:hypothetical protein